MDDEITLREALKNFYGGEAIGRDAFVERINYADFGIVKVPFPNFKMRRELIYLHDINHLLSGYNTSWIGESEVAAWELATGFPRHCWIGYLYAPFALAVGLIIDPNRVYKAFIRGRNQKNSCYANLSKEEMMALPLKNLKTLLGHGTVN